MTFSRLAIRVRKAALIASAIVCALLASSSVTAASARADTLVWHGPVAVASTGGSNPLSGVSCPTASQCTTVDSRGEQVTYAPSSGAVTSRSAIDLAFPLKAVSCPSASQCTAVDTGGNEVTFSPTTGGLINGVGSVHLTAAALNAVSCESGSVCSAVAANGTAVTFDPASGARPAASASQALGIGTALSGVSCPVDGNLCAAVSNTGQEQTYRLDSLGNITATGTAQTAGAYPLTAVSCPTAHQCTLVDNQGDQATFDPTGGAISESPLDNSPNPAMTAISCPSASTCAAVDQIGNELTFTPGAAPSATTASIDGTADLIGVSCAPAATSCSAVDTPEGNEVAFGIPSGTVAGTHSVAAPALVGVACPSRTECAAVSGGPSEITYDPTTGQVNGAGVSQIDSSGNPLTAISCVSSTECTAVDNGGFEATFNPVTGRLLDGGFAALDAESLSSVSCLLTGAGVPQCTTVDVTGNETTFNPSTGIASSAGTNPIDTSGTPSAVSCPSATQCSLVDNQGREITFSPALQPAPTNPVGTIDSGHALTGLACPSTGQCTAVDSAGGVVTFTPAAATASPGRQVLTTSPLNAVACPSTGQCTATDANGEYVTFDPTSSNLPPSLVNPAPQANALSAVSCPTTGVCSAVDSEGNAFDGVAAPVQTAPPTISGTPQQGDQLTESRGTWTNSPGAYAYAWEDCASATDASTCSPISGASGPTYIPTASDVGNYIRVQETASNNGGGNGQPALSAASGQVMPPPPANSGAPTITGTAQDAQRLTEGHGSWSNNPTSYTYQWQRCDAVGANCADMPGATGQTYTATPADIGHTLRVEEAAHNGGTPEPAFVASAATGQVAPPPPPPIQATTLRAAHVTVTAARPQGRVTTQGAAVTWQFVYGLTPHYTAGTPLQSIPAGATGPVTVRWPLTNLKPNTTYHYRLIETAPATPSSSAAQASGQDLTFRTSSLGRIVLGQTRLKLNAAGATEVPLACLSDISCVERFTLSTTAALGQGSSRHFGTILCATTLTSLRAHSRRRVKVKLTRACLALVQEARGHNRIAKFTTRPRTGQLGVIEIVHLIGPRRMTAPAAPRGA